MASLSGRTERHTRDTGWRTNLTGKGPRFWRMARSTKVPSKMGRSTDMEFTYGQTNHNIRVSGETMSLKAKVNIFGVMEGSTLVISREISLMERALWSMKMAESTGASS